MITPNSRNKKTYILILTALLLAGLACSIPGISQPVPTPTAQEPPSGVTTEATEESAPNITPEYTKALPENILTEAAGIIYATITAEANFYAGQTATAMAGSTSELPSDAPLKPTLTPTHTASPTLTPTMTNTPQPTKTDSFAWSPTNTPTSTAILAGYTPVAPDIGVWVTPYFRLRNLNLHDCGINYAAIFKITNTASIQLESLSLKFIDRTTNTVLFGPETNNAPFLSTDRTCDSVGADFLATHQTMYIGNRLGPKTLQAHTIKSIIKLCTKEDLSGICYEAIAEFVVP